MAQSPSKGADGVMSFEISVNGSPIPDTFQVMSIKVTNQLNRLPSATISFEDGDIPNDSYTSIESNTFEPGSKIEIKAGYDSATATIFKGVVAQISLRILNDLSLSILECTDHATALSLVRNSRIFSEASDSDIMQSIISDYTNLSANIETTSHKHESLVKSYASDWDFILARAKANAMMVLVQNNKIDVKTIKAPTSPTLTVTMGIDMFDFEGHINAKPVVKAYTNSAWNSETQQVEEQSSSKSEVDKIGDITNDNLLKVFNTKVKGLHSSAALNKEQLIPLAQADQAYSLLASKTGEFSYSGNSSIALGDTIEMQGVSHRFNGNALVSAIEHELEDGNWLTRVSFGLAPALQVAPSNNDIDYGAMPKVNGLLIGTVKAIHEDPNSSFRVQVILNNGTASEDSIWARLSHLYASNEFGFFFYPEVDDEVVLGFLNNDPNSAIILGSLYSKGIPAQGEVDEENTLKSIITRSKLKMQFDDKNIIFTINTPAGQTICLNDDEKSLSITDCNENSLVMNENGISMKSAKDISIEATGDINIKAGGKIAQEATGDITLAGANIEATAQVAAKTTAATVEASGSAQVTISGAMVMIN